MLVQNKDDVRIPLELEALPTARAVTRLAPPLSGIKSGRVF